MKIINLLVEQVPDKALDGAKTVVNLLLLSCPIAGMISKTTETQLDNEVVAIVENISYKLKFALDMKERERREALAEIVRWAIDLYL